MRGRRAELAVGALLAVGLAVTGWMAIQVGAIGSFAPQVRVALLIDDAAGLQSGAEVKVAGVNVGRIERLSLEDGRARADLSLEASAALRSSVTPRIRSRSVLGEKYVELLLGDPTAPELRDGDVLELPGEQLELDEVMQRLGPLLTALDPEAMAEALAAVSDALREDPERVRRMLEDGERLLAHAADASEDLPGLVERADGVLGRADRSLATLQRTLERAGAPLDKADVLLDDLGEASADLPETLAEARAALDELREALGGADALLAEDGDLRRVLANVAEIDKWELRRLLREEGILIRVKAREVEPTD